MITGDTLAAPGFERAIHSCLVAMDAAGRSAACCLSDPTLATERETSESSVVAARLLGAFADVAGLSLSGPRIHVAAALARAAIVAAEACAAANDSIQLDACVAAADACTVAANELRRTLASLEAVEAIEPELTMSSS